jgi:hypothetical protein
MTRMSKEFSLVLLGAGVLSAGYFVAPHAEEEMEAKSDEQAARRTGHTYHRSGGFFIWMHSPGYAGHVSGRPAAYSSTSRVGGFGSIGKSFSGGS